MKVLVDGMGEVSLTKQDFLDSGGEGDVYKKSNIAFKIYHDPKRMIDVNKIKELQTLEFTNIIKPEKIIYNQKKEPVGYTMNMVNDFYPLSRIITNDFRQQYNIDNDKILNLIIKMKQTIDHIHSKDCLFVDANEMNFLVSKDFSEVFFIDVDSYKTKNFKATAYTDIALDPNIDIQNQKTLSAQSDWYSFAILACKMLTGIHPFKGKFKDKSKMSVKNRMIKSISIFNSAISLPKTVRDISKIPNNYKDWFLNVFEKGARTEPPVNIDEKYYKSTANMILKDIINFILIKDFEDNINYITSFSDKLFVKTVDSIKNINENFKVKDPENTYPFYSFIHGDLLIKLENRKVKIHKMSTKENFDTDIEVDELFVKDNVILGVSRHELQEIVLFEKNNKIQLVKSVHTSVYQNSLNRINNVFVNKYYEKNILMFHTSTGVIFKDNFKELEKCTVVEAKYQNKILGISYIDPARNKKTIYYRFNDSFLSREVIYEEDDMDVDFAVSEQGVLIINDKESLILRSNIYKKTGEKKVKDDNLSNVRLYANRSQILAISKNLLYAISMK